ncbi:MAG: 7TM diverse intracellular signaling domain-containing protein [Cytophagaceae bacterium]
MTFRLLLVLFLLNASFNSLGNSLPLITLNKIDSIYHLGAKVLIYEDKEGKLQLPDVLNLSNFTKSHQEIPAWSATNSAVWVKFNLINESSFDDWYFETTYPIHEIDIYIIENENTTHVKSGFEHFYSQNFIQNNYFIIPFKINKNGKAECYIRFRNLQGLRLPIKIASLQKLYEKNHTKNLLSSIYYGIVISLIIINLFVFISIRDLTYIYYIFYISFWGLTIAYLQGYAFRWIGSSLYIWSPALSILFALLFSMSFLKLKNYSKKLYRFRWVVVIILIFSVILNLSGKYAAAHKCSLFNPFLIYAIIIGVSVYKKGFQPAKLYVLGFLCVNGSVIFVALTGFKIIEADIPVEHVLQIGSAFESIILSFAMSEKFKLFKQEKEEILKEKLKLSENYSRQLIQSQELEKKRIAAELHDSLGQKLIIIKNKILLSKTKAEKEKLEIEKLNVLATDISGSIHNVRRISYQLHPYQLNLLGLTKSLELLTEESEEKYKVCIDVVVDNIDSVFNEENQVIFYRIVQDSINNLVRFSQPEKINLKVSKLKNTIVIKIEAYGVTNHHSGYNIDIHQKTISESVKILGGIITNENEFNQKSAIKIIIPV